MKTYNANFEIYADEFLKYLNKRDVDFESVLKKKIIKIIDILKNPSKNDRNSLISRYLNSFKIKFSEKINLLKEICDNQEFINFLHLLKNHNEFNNLHEILDVLLRKFNLTKKIIDVKVLSVISLDDEQISLVKNLVKKETGFKANVSNIIDKGIIGGIVIKFHDKLIDLSIKKILNKTQKRIFG